MVRRLTDAGFFARIELPQVKDCNDDLTAYRFMLREQRRERNNDIQL